VSLATESDPKRVLIADDELNMRKVLEAMLRREGYDVVTAANGLDALAGMNRDVHTVITDLKMPGLDGMGLLKKLSADYPDVPVVNFFEHFYRPHGPDTDMEFRAISSMTTTASVRLAPPPPNSGGTVRARKPSR